MKRQKAFCKKQGYSPEDVAAHNLAGLSLTIKDYKATAEELGIGEITLRDIVKRVGKKPARDPRDEMPKPILRTDVLEMKDLKRRNDIEKERCETSLISACLWISEFIRTVSYILFPRLQTVISNIPFEAVSVGDVVDVKVMSVDMKKKKEEDTAYDERNFLKKRKKKEEKI